MVTAGGHQDGLVCEAGCDGGGGKGGYTLLRTDHEGMVAVMGEEGNGEGDGDGDGDADTG